MASFTVYVPVPPSVTGNAVADNTTPGVLLVTASGAPKAATSLPKRSASLSPDV